LRSSAFIYLPFPEKKPKPGNSQKNTKDTMVPAAGICPAMP
jgi:hypothetical protein